MVEQFIPCTTSPDTYPESGRRCYRDGQFEQAVGIALEARRLDQLEAATKRSPAPVKTLTYALRVSQRLVISRQFREQVRAADDTATRCHVLLFVVTHCPFCPVSL